MAPEIVQNKEDNFKNKHFINSKADIWAVGCICYELLTGITPFDGS